MRQPKYRLSEKDEQRWHDLLVLHCISELTLDQSLEFKALDMERDRRLNRRPDMKAARKAQQIASRKAEQKLQNTIVDLYHALPKGFKWPELKAAINDFKR